jgi:hypothetical protein
MAIATAEAQAEGLENEVRRVAEAKRTVVEAPKGAERKALGFQESKRNGT